MIADGRKGGPGRIRPLSVDLADYRRRSVASLYSNLVTRPTGRAVRMGVESQIAELERSQALCLLVLDFSQVRILDFSCADEIVAKLILRYAQEQPAVQVYFLARGVHDHHAEAIEAVLDRHGLLLVTESEAAVFRLLGSRNEAISTCWDHLHRHGRLGADEAADCLGVDFDTAAAVLASLAAHRVVVPFADGSVRPVHLLDSPDE